MGQFPTIWYSKPPPSLYSLKSSSSSSPLLLSLLSLDFFLPTNPLNIFAFLNAFSTAFSAVKRIVQSSFLSARGNPHVSFPFSLTTRNKNSRNFLFVVFTLSSSFVSTLAGWNCSSVPASPSSPSVLSTGTFGAISSSGIIFWNCSLYSLDQSSYSFSHSSGKDSTTGSRSTITFAKNGSRASSSPFFGFRILYVVVSLNGGGSFLFFAAERLLRFVHVLFVFVE